MAKRNKSATAWHALTDMQRQHAIGYVRGEARSVVGEGLSVALDSLANLGDDASGTLTYWIADCLDDRPSYSIRARTRKECADERKRSGASGYAQPRKVTIQYRDAFDLARRLLGECGAEG